MKNIPPRNTGQAGINMDEKEVKVDEVSVSDDAVEKQQDTAASSDIAPDSDQAVNDTDTEIEKLNNQIAELTDKFLRLAAELENTRRRAALDIESSARNRAMSVAKKFLPVMDAIEAAQQHAPNDEGIKSMAKAMNDAFAQIGITKIESVGQVLNPQFHNAIQVVESEDADNKPKPNTIVKELQSGYMFGDTVMRTAMVVVSK